MNQFYVACELGTRSSRIVMGCFEKNKITLSEVHRFANEPVKQDDTLTWDIELLYRETLAGLRTVGSYEEPVYGVSFSSWSGDYLLFDSNGAMMSPAYHRADLRAKEGMDRVLAKI